MGIFLAFIVYGKRTRKIGHNLNAMTFPELLGKRFDSKFVQYFSGLVIFFGMPLYASVVLIGAARFMETTLAINFDVALLIYSVIIAAYVVWGGLRGVMYTDAMQGTIMFVGMAFLLVMTYSHLGGITAAHQALTDMANLVPAKLAAQGHTGWTSMPTFASTWWWTLISTIVMGVGIGVLAMPQLVVRFMTVKSNRELNRGVLIGGIFILAMTGVAFVVGALSNVFFYQTQGNISINIANGNADSIIPIYINAATPEWFVYLFMLTLLAAAMSTSSSQFHAQGSAIGRDIYETLTHKKGGGSISDYKDGNHCGHSNCRRLGIYPTCKHNRSRYSHILWIMRSRLPSHVHLWTLLARSHEGRSHLRLDHRHFCNRLLVSVHP